MKKKKKFDVYQQKLCNVSNRTYFSIFSNQEIFVAFKSMYCQISLPRLFLTVEYREITLRKLNNIRER